jgi:hypothetical protein
MNTIFVPFAFTKELELNKLTKEEIFDKLEMPENEQLR